MIYLNNFKQSLTTIVCTLFLCCNVFSIHAKDNNIFTFTKNSFDQRITGTVKDNKGEPIAGANVLVKGTNKGTTTDVDGNFSLDVREGEILVISYVGMKTQEVKIGSEASIAIVIEEDAGSLGEVKIVGSFAKPRTDVNRPVPVDVITAKELQQTGQVDLGQMVQYTSPSYNSAKTGINGAANYADPATLRGLGPDQTLVLINGKRRHQFSSLNLNVTVGNGTVVTDLNAIPSLAIERTEILRDGAAAQYGSDAIAGIVNLALKKQTGSGSFKGQYGMTGEGDGASYMAALNYGFKLGKEGSYFNFTGTYQNTEATERSDNYTGFIYNTNRAKDDSIRLAKGVYPKNGSDFKIGKYGSNAVKAYQGFYNMAYPIAKDWKLYSFGGYSKKDILAYGFFRNAVPANANSNVDKFPNGYNPELPGTSLDYSTVVGVSRSVENGWNMDLSTAYGYNHLDQNANNTTNPSMGAASPTEFYVGRSVFGQSTTDLSFSKALEGFLKTKSTNVAFGAQYRRDNYQLLQGSVESYQVGPLATKGKAIGSSARPGIAPDDQTNESRSNIGVYADVESDITDRILVTAAARFENYSDFGNNVSGKLATRIKLAKNLAVRSSVNLGFRAPSLQQSFNSVTTSTVQTGAIVQTKQIRSDDARAIALGFPELKAETSKNFNVGLTGKVNEKLYFTLDAYQIDIADRIILSERLIVKDIASLKTPFAGINEIRVFTNQLDTRTRGIDFVTTFKHSFTEKSGINASIALTSNETNIRNIKETPAALQVGTPKKILIIDTVAISLIETAQPRQKLHGSVTYTYSKFNVNVRANHFGAVTAWEKPAGKPHITQTFAAKTTFDVALSYNVTSKIGITLGANNFTNVYPDKVITTYPSYSAGEIPYSRNVNQFGFNGAFYYANLNVNF